MAIDLMAEEKGRKSPMVSQQEKIEDTNETHHHHHQKKKKKKKKRTKKKEEKRRQKGEEEGKWLKHYSSVHQILLVGEGDFSFSLSLANAFGSASNIVATSLDRFDQVIKKYRNTKSNLENLLKLGATVLHGVDATKMKLHTDLSMREFNRIIFNFPHAGFYGKEHQSHLIRLHRNLVQGFFKNASQMLCPFGEIHVSHKTGEPYDWWSLEKLAWKCSLALMECVNFEKEDYPGYNNKRGHGARCDEPFPLDEVIKKYGNAKSNPEKLVKLGATGLHGVDATKMKLHTDLSMWEFDRIIFNFPHTGFYGQENQNHLIRNLVQGFFKNASQMLCPFGEIHVSHKTGVPYHWWNHDERTWNCSHTHMECVNFEKEDFPGYNNKRSHGVICDEPFPLGVCSTFKFQVNTQKGKTTYTCGQSFLNITETQHTRSAGVIWRRANLAEQDISTDMVIRIVIH